jgi:hypothetical protein
MAKVIVENKRLLARLKNFHGKAADLRKPNKKFAQYFRVAVDRHFKALKKGGTNRGVTWKPFAPQYTRKTDGAVVPAWGGTKKVRGAGRVKGRLRPSGTRITKGSALLQDTNTLRSRATLTIRQTRTSMEVGPQGVNYAAKQHARRPFLFFTQSDGNKYGEIVRRHLGQK